MLSISSESTTQTCTVVIARVGELSVGFDRGHVEGVAAEIIIRYRKASCTHNKQFVAYT
jgi:hypothetical protein